MGKAIFDLGKINNTYFIENYDIVMCTIGQEEKQTILIDDHSNTCRFCGRKKHEVKFNNKSHAIPEAFGNKKVITRNECNECNQKYANIIENDLLNLTLPSRTVTRVFGKNGIPKYKDITTNNSCEYKDGKFVINDYENFSIMEDENKQIRLKFKTTKMTPLKAYKALVRIALNCLPKAYFDRFKMIEWLESDQDLGGTTEFYTKVITVFMPKINPMFNICLFIRKPNILNVPYCQMVLQVNNIFYQVIIPFIEEDLHLEKETKVIIEPFSFGVVDDDTENTIAILKLESKEKKVLTTEFVMNYKEKRLLE